MAQIKIGIVEDEMVIARTIESTLGELGYASCGPACTYGEALEMIEDEQPDLLLLDIQLAGKKDGIDVAEKINLFYSRPFIFLTANSDISTIERAKKVKPHAYIVKPFTKDELYAAIEIAMNNYKKTHEIEHIGTLKEEANRGFVFLKDGQHFHKVFYDEILYLESENNYASIHMVNKKKIMIRSSFADFLKTLPESMFHRVHRSYAVQLAKINSLEVDDVVVDGIKISVSKSYRDELLKTLGIRKQN
jgi:DNA-binding LytR/AlgR family response regulator